MFLQLQMAGSLARVDSPRLLDDAVRSLHQHPRACRPERCRQGGLGRVAVAAHSNLGLSDCQPCRKTHIFENTSQH